MQPMANYGEDGLFTSLACVGNLLAGPAVLVRPFPPMSMKDLVRGSLCRPESYPTNTSTRGYSSDEGNGFNGFT